MPSVTRVRSAADVRRFVDLDLALYRDEPRYVPPLRRDLLARVRRWTGTAPDAPLRAALFLVEDGGATVGRIAASVDRTRTSREDGAPFATFGFLEAVDDRAVFGALFGAAEEWLAGHGAGGVRGPFSFGLDDPYGGLLVDGFDEPPSFGATWSPPFYPDNVAALGYRADLELRTWSLALPSAPDPALAERIAAARARSGVAVRALRAEAVADEARLVRRVLDGAREGEAPVPLGDDPLRDLVPLLKLVADPRLVLFATVAGEAVGCLLALPDWNDVLRSGEGRLLPLQGLRLLLGRRGRRRLRVLVPGVLPAHRRGGLAALLLDTALRAAAVAGYGEVELDGVPEASAPLRGLAERFGRPTRRRHRVFGKELR